LIVLSVVIFAAAFAWALTLSRWSLRPADLLWLLGVFVVHDAYFYWCHRMLHHRRFWRFHRAHHCRMPMQKWHSLKVSPLEAILEAAFMPVIAGLWSPNIVAFVIFAAGMMAVNWFGHAGTLFGFRPQPNFRWLNRPDDHELHHELPAYNLSAYFPWWDLIGGTRWLPIVTMQQVEGSKESGQDVKSSTFVVRRL
jgi:sterol desaturase/sphingolipid hydroxylase (fatty acid hydroxylase superfamily)